MNAVRALEVLRRLDRPIVRTGEAAAVLGISVSNASHLLASLQDAGSVLRISPGRWSMAPQPRPYLVASWLTDPYPSYVSLYTALSRRGLISQIPRTIYVVSLAKTRTLATPVGTYSVHRLPPELFGGYEEPMASVWRPRRRQSSTPCIWLALGASGSAISPRSTFRPASEMTC